MTNILLCWIGQTDLNAEKDTERVGLGPIAQALHKHPCDQVYLLYNYSHTQVRPYLAWLKNQTDIPIHAQSEKLSSPMHFGEIYKAARKTCEAILAKHGTQTNLTFHISPGTSAMAAVWILISKTIFPANLIQSSIQQGLQIADVPFDIAAEFYDILSTSDQRLQNASEAKPAETAGFEDILYRSKVMRRVVEKAQRAALRNIPVLIEGPSGTGKELFARAIHNTSPRKEKPLITVNCGAIPHALVESELFGHEKGSFTGADKQRKGHFEMANGGTIFLDEIGELPKDMQVRLLRVLQEGEITRVGSSTPINVDVRLIAATNRTLTEEVAADRFREDLFYRLAVAYLKLPALAERTGDLTLLIDTLLERVNQESEEDPTHKHKKLSVSARNLLQKHTWPGNVRELINTLKRAVLWSSGDSLTKQDIQDAILPPIQSTAESILDQSLGNGFSLQSTLDEVAKHYLERAWEESNQTKNEAAKLIGLPNYQTFSNWLKKYGIDAGT